MTNTICTAGDSHYLWGLFLLVASMRRHGMKEPVLAGVKGFSPHDARVLEQFDGVRLMSLDHADHSLTCHKAEVMMKADSDFVTWADSDAMFKGNCSDLLVPPDEGMIRVRRRSAPEMPGAFPRRYDLNTILPTWREDVASVLRDQGLEADPPPPPAVPDFLSCSACYLSLARSQDRFLRVWHEMMMRLPKGNVGVVDRSLACYHQLDESCLNACLTFMPGAPQVTEVYGLDRDPERIYLHFIGRPKPWEGWTRNAIRHFDTVVSTVEWAKREGLELPGPVPRCLDRNHEAGTRFFVRWTELWFKIRRRLFR